MPLEKDVPKKEWDRRTFLSFGALGLFGLGIFGVRRWIAGSPDVSGAAAPFRRVFEFNEGVVTLIKSNDHLAPEFPRERAAMEVRTNGTEGIASPLDAAAWALSIQAHGSTPARVVTMAEIRALPRTEIIFDFKCIEGWSQVSHWGGVRLRDLAAHFGVGTRNGSLPTNERPDDLFRYMALTTPDNGYYVGIDMQSALHPQTILAYEMNGAPLPEPNGAPLRLIIPTKYGVKNLKRIGTMAFSDERPPDYWAERGYDYDCTL